MRRGSSRPLAGTRRRNHPRRREGITHPGQISVAREFRLQTRQQIRRSFGPLPQERQSRVRVPAAVTKTSRRAIAVKKARSARHWPARSQSVSVLNKAGAKASGRGEGSAEKLPCCSGRRRPGANRIRARLNRRRCQVLGRLPHSRSIVVLMLSVA
jgi:hypothetical protein